MTSDESLEEFAERCQRLAGDAWEAIAPESVSIHAMDAFLHGQTDKEAVSAMALELENLDETLSYVKKAIHDRRALYGSKVLKSVKTVCFDDNCSQFTNSTVGTPERKNGSSSKDGSSDKTSSSKSNLETRLSSVESDQSQIKKDQGEIKQMLQKLLARSTPPSSPR